MSNTFEHLRDTSMGPDFFGLYANEVSELMAQDVDFAPFFHQGSHLIGNLNRLGRKNLTTENGCRIKENNNKSTSSPTSLYANGVGALVSEFGKERIKLLLQQSVSTLSQEVDEVVDPVISLRRLQSWLRCKDRLLLGSNELSRPDDQEPLCKKLKMLPSSSLHDEACGFELNVGMNGSNIFPDNGSDKEQCEIDDDVLFLFNNNSAKVEELINSHSTELFIMLQHMDQKLEELLNMVMKSCRPMTINEKQQLCKSIKELPSKNVDRVLEILRHSEPSRTISCDEVFVDLDQVECVTLWRLYFYVAATSRAKSYIRGS